MYERVKKLKASGSLDKFLQDMTRKQFLDEWKDMYQEIEVSKMDSIQILDEPSIYAEQKHRNAKQESEKALDKRSGTKRAITIWFSNSVLERVALELGKDAILLPADRNGFITTITKRPDKRFYNWLETFGQNAELRAPDDLVEKYVSRKKAMLSEKLLRSFYGNQLKDH
jgi:predicted DNA-binding transcriptional regulator YafY